MEILKVYIANVGTKSGDKISLGNQNKFINMVEPRTIVIKTPNGENMTLPANYLDEDKINESIKFLEEIDLHYDEINIIKDLLLEIWPTPTVKDASNALIKLLKLGLNKEIVSECNKMINPKDEDQINTSCIGDMAEFCMENKDAAPLMVIYTSYVSTIL